MRQKLERLWYKVIYGSGLFNFLQEIMAGLTMLLTIPFVLLGSVLRLAIFLLFVPIVIAVGGKITVKKTKLKSKKHV